MNKIINKGLILFILLSIFTSCRTSPISKIQGVFEVDKESLKKNLLEKFKGENEFALGLINSTIEGAIIEFCIKGDSIVGIFYMAGESSIIESKIIDRNDSLIVLATNNEVYIEPTETGLNYTALKSGIPLKLNKTNRTDLSPKTKETIENQKIELKEKEAFEQNLGKWQVGNYVDEFGDKTGDKYAYSIVKGFAENSISSKTDVYVKTMIENKKLSFEIFDISMSMKESFPENEFVTIKFKLPDGSVKSERFFFYKNSAYEDETSILYNYMAQNEGIIKVFIDLSTVGSYYSDKYQFDIQRNNLNEILNTLE